MLPILTYLTARYGAGGSAIVLCDASREHVEDAVQGIEESSPALAMAHLALPCSAKRLTVSIGRLHYAPR